MTITKEMLKKAAIDAMWLHDLNEVLSEKAITEPVEIAMFMSQCAYESKRFTMLEENLNYTPQRLLEVFPNRFSSLEHAKEICLGGVKSIGNYIYGGRLGNTPGTNDGYNYRGRGIIQLTGKANYSEFSRRINVDLVAHPILAKEKRNAILIACEFWTSRKCQEPARNSDVLTVTKLINGAYNGIAGRERIFFDYEAIFA